MMFAVRSLLTALLCAPLSLAPVAANPLPPAAFVPPPVAREFRAAWVSPVYGGGRGDWPSAPGLSPDSQRAELRALFDRARAMGLNAIILHVRMAGDAFYPTPLAPWSAFLTGTSGADPGYDPLAFAIDEAHRRGLQLHAWFNPFRAMLPNFAGRAAPTHVTRVHPEWIRKYGSQTWIDPGDPDARRAVLDAIIDVVRRYDVDGIHIDDYFYPYRESEKITKRVKKKRVTITRDIPFPDDKTWKKYGLGGGWTDRDDWRRDNVDGFVREMYADVKAIKPWVSVGISPFGIWRSGTPAGITGLDAFGEIYADSRLWLQQGWLDYFVPQLYWQLDGTQHRFTTLDAWWRTQNPHNRYIWPGLATMHIGSGRWPTGEIAAQITTVRTARDQTPDVPGHVHFRMSSIGTLDGERLRFSVYSTPALVPAFPWLGARAPSVPVVHVTPAPAGAARVVTIEPSDTTTVAWWLVQARNDDGSWTPQLQRAGTGPATLIVPVRAERTVIAVRAIDRVGQEGPPTIVQW